MTLWNRFVTFLVPASSQDARGAWNNEYVPSAEDVRCNERTRGLVALGHLRSSDIRMTNVKDYVDRGLTPEREIEVYAIDYEGEDRCEYEGREYEVLYTYGGGRTLVLGLGGKIGNEVPNG